jgi:hypothetical protein
LSFADILSESRKHALSVVLAHQYLEQVDERIRSAVLGNVGTIIYFRLGAEDAKYLAPEFAPTFTEGDLIELPNHNILLKLLVEGVTLEPFSATTLQLPELASSSDKVIETSRLTYRVSRREVEGILLHKARDPERQLRLL